MKYRSYIKILLSFLLFSTFSIHAQYAGDEKYLNNFDEKRALQIITAEGLSGKKAAELLSKLKKAHIENQKNAEHPFDNNKTIYVNLSPSSNPACPNAGFEQGTFSGWRGYTWTLVGNTWGPNIPTPAQWVPGIVAIRQAIETTHPGNQNASTGTVVGYDPIAIDPATHLSGISLVSPTGNGSSVKLGNSNVGGETERLVYSMTTTVSNSQFIYQYAVVLNNPSLGHSTAQQPFFQISFTDSATNLPIGGACANSPINSDSAAVPKFGFRHNLGDTYNGFNDVFYKPWSTVSVDLSPAAGIAIGTKVNIEFRTADCSLGGHFGYAYIDAACGTMNISAPITKFCSGTSSLSLFAPQGYSTYSWSGPGIVGANNGSSAVVNAPGTYSVVVTSYCGTSSTLTVTTTASSNTAPSITLNGVNTICRGQTTLLTASGGKNYSWSPNLSGAVSDTLTVMPQLNTTYTVTGTDTSGCGSNATYSVNVNQLPVVVTSVSPANDTICSGASAVLTASGASTYLWSANAGGVNTNSVTVSPVINTTYTVTGTDANGCINTAIKTINVINCSAGIHQFSGNDNTVIVYPNPADNNITIHSSLPLGAVSIFNSLGEMVFQGRTGETQFQTDISKFPAGIYIVQVQSYHIRLIKE